MADRFEVSIQGFTQDMSAADGSYDSIELGAMNPDELIALLQKLSPMKTPEGAAGSDMCPASVHVQSGGETYSFEMCGGSLLCANTNATISVFDAVSLVTGKATRAQVAAKTPAAGSAVLAWGSDNPDVKGLSPVRKKDLPPTDRANACASTINTGPSSPQVSVEVWKSDAAKAGPVAMIVMACLAALMVVAGIAAKEWAVIAIGVAGVVVCWFLRGLLARAGRGEFRLGFDWKTNTVWALMPKAKTPSWLGNANCVTDLTVGKLSYQSAYRTNTASPVGRVRTTETRWQLVVHKNNNTAIPLVDFFARADAQAACAAAKTLLAGQS